MNIDDIVAMNFDEIQEAFHLEKKHFNPKKSDIYIFDVYIGDFKLGDVTLFNNIDTGNVEWINFYPIQEKGSRYENEILYRRGIGTLAEIYCLKYLLDNETIRPTQLLLHSQIPAKNRIRQLRRIGIDYRYPITVEQELKAFMNYAQSKGLKME